jgi:hypothetical protein
MGAAEISAIILTGLQGLQQWATLQATLQAENRSATLEELKALRANDLVARDALEAAIAAHPDVSPAGGAIAP